jgi:hypothetical protein
MRKSLVAAVIAVAVAAPIAPSAFASSTHANSHSKCAASVDVSAKAFKKAAAKAKHEKRVKDTFVNAGWVTVDATDTALTFRVKGGPDKCLRNELLTVVITPDTKIMKDDVLAPATSIKVGDHVNVKGTKTKLTVEGSLVSGGSLYTAKRISAESPEVEPTAPPVPSV